MICQKQIKKDGLHFTYNKQFITEIHFFKNIYASGPSVIPAACYFVLWSRGMHLVPFLDIMTEQHMRLFHLIPV